MRFAFTDDQLAFRDAVRDLLGATCPPEVVRSAWPEGSLADGARPGDGARADAGAPAGAWAALADMGVLGMAVPEDRGGLGLGELDWVLLAEEAGYAGLPLPFVETVGVAAPALAAAADAGVAEAVEVLDALVAGDEACTAVPSPADPVPWSTVARRALVLDGDAATLVPADVLTAGDALDGVDGARRPVRLPGGWAGRPDVLSLPGGGSIAGPARQRAVLGTAAQLVGLGRRQLEITVAYVQERKQFGVAIGSFQAVKHHLADAQLGLEFAAPAVHRAAWSLATGAPTAARDVAMAKALAGDAALRCGRKALQCHGGIGYTVEYDLHLYLKRSWALARSWGDAAEQRAVVAGALGMR